MKKNLFIKSSLMASMFLLVFSCSDFEEINVDSIAASEDQVQVEYFLANSIVGAQMDPHIAERAFVLYWKGAGRLDRINALPVGYADDGWSGDYYRYNSDWLNAVNSGITIGNNQIDAGTEKIYTKNLIQISRIWRAYLISEIADSFGPAPIDGFQGVNPDFSSVKDVYYYMLAELKEAVAEIDPSVVNPASLNEGNDAAFGFDYEKWQRYGNSLRMRLAMRLSEVDASKAQTEFEDAASGNLLINSMDQAFQVQELSGWNGLTGVMSREWNAQKLNATLNNLMIGLGGVKSSDQLDATLHGYIKPANYMGAKYDAHFSDVSNDPSRGFWFDGLHDVIDPRAYKAFPIPGDFDNPDFCKYPSWSTSATTTVRDLLEDDGETIVKTIDAAFSWNAPTHGSFGEKGAKNQVYNFTGTTPRLGLSFRDSSNKRIFFAPWETNFLLAEAAVRGWTTPTGAQAAYEEGIKLSLEYFGASDHLASYLSSTDYNRVGTSVSWTHTIEPSVTVMMDYVDGYTDAAGTVNFTYPTNDLYENGTVKNDFLTKIITQKFIAQNPWLPLETWNDHRRLGLPFFENPTVENALANLPALNPSNVGVSKVEFFPQRLKYPSSLEASDPAGYGEAVQLLGGADDVFTPLWWAKQD